MIASKFLYGVASAVIGMTLFMTTFTSPCEAGWFKSRLATKQKNNIVVQEKKATPVTENDAVANKEQEVQKDVKFLPNEAAKESKTEVAYAPIVLEPVDFYLTCQRAILVDGKTGQVLYNKDADLLWHPASTTKVMAALLILENGKLEDTTTVSNTATDLYGGYHSNWLYAGMKFTIDQLLHILLIESDNASCNTLAEYLDGTQEKFVERMNNKAREMGLSAHFVTPYGRAQEEHKVTARDLYLITKAAMQYPAFREIVRTPVYHISTPYMNQSFRNRNQFIGVDPRVLGVKTGYTHAAQCNLICYAEENGHSLYTVVMGAPREDIDYSYLDSKKLLDYGFRLLNAQRKTN